MGRKEWIHDARGGSGEKDSEREGGEEEGEEQSERTADKCTDRRFHRRSMSDRQAGAHTQDRKDRSETGWETSLSLASMERILSTPSMTF